MTLKPVAERLAVKLLLPVFTTHACRYRESNPISSVQGESSTCVPPRRLITVNILTRPKQCFFFFFKI